MEKLNELIQEARRQCEHFRDSPENDIERIHWKARFSALWEAKLLCEEHMDRSKESSGSEFFPSNESPNVKKMTVDIDQIGIGCTLSPMLYYPTSLRERGRKLLFFPLEQKHYDVVYDDGGCEVLMDGDAPRIVNGKMVVYLK